MDDRIGLHKYSCKYPKCRNRYYTPIYRQDYDNKRFYRFPKNGTTSLAWKDICNMDPSVMAINFFICEDHFTPTDFVNQSKHRLRVGAIPIRLSQPSDISDHDYMGESRVKYKSFRFEPVATSVTQSIVHSPTTDSPHDKYTFLLNNNGEIPAYSSSSFVDTESKKLTMMNIHQMVSLNILRLKNILYNEKHVLHKLFWLYNDGKFDVIDRQLCYLSNEFLQYHLEHDLVANKWTEADHYLALSLYNRNEKLYRYLSSIFHLPSVEKLKLILSNVYCKTGIIKPLLGQMKLDINKMEGGNQTCVLLMDEMMLTCGINYDETCQNLCGYEDLGHLGRTAKAADRVLVLMVRGVRKNWTQVVSYYFAHGPFEDISLQNIIVMTVKYLQVVGLNVVAFVCKPNTTNLKALALLTAKTQCRFNSFYFLVNTKRISVIFDVRHLLKETRDALVKCKISYDETGKSAKFEHIQSAYSIDQSKRIFKQLYKLKDQYFETKDSSNKMDITASRVILSHTMAASIETFVVCGELPQEAMNTAEFVEIMDMLFDSLNGSEKEPTDNKKYRCMLSQNSPHLTFWTSLLKQFNKWKLMDLSSGQDVTDQYFVVGGWKITMESVLYIWSRLRHLDYLSLRRFNLEPLENLLEGISRYGTNNKSPTCHQFLAALKAEILNGTENPWTADDCYNLISLRTFFEYVFNEDSNSSENVKEICFDNLNFNKIINFGFHEEAAYLSGYLLQKLDIPDCATCRAHLLGGWVINNSDDVSRTKYGDDSTYSIYASDAVVRITDRILYLLYHFLKDQSNQPNLETNFKALYKHEYESFKFCTVHSCNEDFVNLCVKLGIYRFVYGFNKGLIQNSSG